MAAINVCGHQLMITTHIKELHEVSTVVLQLPVQVTVCIAGHEVQMYDCKQ